MTSRIANVTQTPPQVKEASKNPAEARTSATITADQKPVKPVTSQTTATISDAAKAALLESTETPAQTAKEARGNDHQAQRLLAKENAAKLAMSKT